ncbi:hypothetical protein [Delftia sp. CH05]|uniref:hypothetical protein n=1 Tax=Delftia sp. CH05 TaxID=2692194 RepID=UPI00135E2029|nr:hypothetical protein [Delftia sp. CH05]MXN31021.1 hypothetical protein [Delftia sp. CH05]
MLSYVNIHGRPVSVAPPPEVKKKARAQPDAFHKGWRVMGIPPGSLGKAQQEHIKKARDAEKRGKPIADFDQGAWIAKTRKKPVRSKPYEVMTAAMQCKALAERGGWLALELAEVTKGAVDDSRYSF